MTALVKSTIWLLILGLAFYVAAIFYAWKFGMTGSKSVFLAGYVLGCLLVGFGAAIGSVSLLKAKWPQFTGLTLGFAAFVFVCVTVAMLYGMVNY